MKNKNLLIIGIVAVVLIIGGVYLFNMNKSATPVSPNTQQTVNSQSANSASEEIEANIKSFLTGTKSVSCSYSNTADDVTVTGNIYAAGGKVRQDFDSMTPAGKTTGHMIIESKDAYMWTDQMKQGFKFSIDGQPAADSQNNQTADINKNMKFSCKPWNADNSLFTLPSDVTFQTMTIPAMPQSGSNGEESNSTNMSGQCAVCDNLPAGSARDTCKSQLKCP